MANRTMVLYRHELKRLRVRGLIGMLPLLASAVIVAVGYSFLVKMMPNGMLSTQGMPPSLLQQLQMQLSDYELYVWGNWYGKNLLQFIVLFAILLGSPAVAGEASKGTTQFTLTRPFSRSEVVWVKAAAAFTWLLAMALIPTVLLWILSGAVGQPVPLFWLMQGIPGTMAGVLLVLGVSVLMSVLTRDPMHAGLLAAVVTILLAALQPLAPTLRLASYVYYMIYGGPQLPPAWFWVGLAGFAAAGAALIALAARQFNRQDY